LDFYKVTNGHLKACLDGRGCCKTENTPNQVKDALNKVLYRPDSRDPEGSVLAFFTDLAAELRRNRAKRLNFNCTIHA